MNSIATRIFYFIVGGATTNELLNITGALQIAWVGQQLRKFQEENPNVTIDIVSSQEADYIMAARILSDYTEIESATCTDLKLTTGIDEQINIPKFEIGLGKVIDKSEVLIVVTSETGVRLAVNWIRKHSGNTKILDLGYYPLRSGDIVIYQNDSYQITRNEASPAGDKLFIY